LPTVERDAGLKAQLNTLHKTLDMRASQNRLLAGYDEGGAQVPDAIVAARVTRAYRRLMPISTQPWGSLVVDAPQDRIQVAGIKDEDQAVADRCWELWQENRMDAESTLLHRSTLRDGRAFALVWPGDEGPEVSLDDSSQMAVQYREGSRYRRQAAMRRWVDDAGASFVTLYRRDGIFKYFGKSEDNIGEQWLRRETPGEPWPLPNPFKLVPVVEYAVNRRLAPGTFPYARGEYAHLTGLIDKINLLTFLGLVVAFWMGFPLRAIIGDEILRDDDGNPIAPYEAMADSVAQFENPETKLDGFAAADRKNLSVYPELGELASLTQTPRHYFPLEGGLSNVSADAIRAWEGGLHAKVSGHQRSLEESHEETLRLMGLMAPDSVDLSPMAELEWKDRESRSLAERADAATKLASIQGIPFQAVAELAGLASSGEVAKWEAMASSSMLGQLLTAAQQPVPPAEEPVAVPAGQ
jgi:hypothetical protein